MENENGTICLAFVSTVLHLRGRKTPQPLQDDCGNILLWNGEIFGGLAVSRSSVFRLLGKDWKNKRYSWTSICDHLLQTTTSLSQPWPLFNMNDGFRIFQLFFSSCKWLLEASFDSFVWCMCYTTQSVQRTFSDNMKLHIIIVNAEIACNELFSKM